VGSSARIGHATISLGGLTLPNGLEVERVQAVGGGFAADLEAKSWTLDAPAEVEATVLPGAIESLLRSKLPASVRNVQVECAPGEIVVRAEAQLVLTVAVTIRVSARVVDGSRLELAVADVQPGLARGLVEDEVAKANPVIDTAGLPVRVVLESVEIGPGGVVLRASAPAQSG
jgi:hypothetical protein